MERTVSPNPLHVEESEHEIGRYFQVAGYPQGNTATGRIGWYGIRRDNRLSFRTIRGSAGIRYRTAMASHWELAIRLDPR